mmetsp:Transcript_30408/g.34544  ORF Transcript_30408/g.34544 Transcript_30408/m.34544 type:complete len:382 (-) Transcript_30408:34-1179(-)
MAQISKAKRKKFKILSRSLLVRWYKFFGGVGILAIIYYDWYINSDSTGILLSSSLSSSSSSSFLRGQQHQRWEEKFPNAPKKRKEKLPKAQTMKSPKAQKEKIPKKEKKQKSPKQNNDDNNNNKKKNIALRSTQHNSTPDALKWVNMTRDEMRDELECDIYYKKEGRVHQPEIWIGMREAYISVVGEKIATIQKQSIIVPSSKSTSISISLSFDTAFQVPFEVRQSPGKGRGLFALQDVKKGTILYDFSQTAQFRTGNDFAEFLRILQPELSCDVLQWSYVQDLSNGFTTKEMIQEQTLRIMTDLDPGSFCNNGGHSKGNMGWIISNDDNNPTNNNTTAPIIGRHDTVKSAPLVALRDIDANEELLCIYSQFSEGLSKMIK